MSERECHIMEPAVLFVRPQAISAADKKALVGAGIVVVEVDDPQSVKLIRAQSEVSGGTMMMAALRAINEHSSDSLKTLLVKHLMMMIDKPE